ncbi:sugar transferase [Pseudanabaena mucicola]|uniref:Sugar transferase n=1 Tax=Pseudanabaena mucicola FACHB-723 TaxID=2692860 RepID=A0ABR8A289_9CYAN|nr:sugar transferase [Pseudanabaena mucicola]MBD2189954.1 sugar transferase [Pseudanabaena mucicola FACHB-723]
MLLITVGTEQYQFNALMHWVEVLIKYQLINEEVLVQYGASTYLPDGARAYRNLPEQDFLKFVDQASLIISHCDESVAQLLEDKDVPYVLVPRLHRFRENSDNHQMEVAEDFERCGIAIARSPGDLVKFIKLQQSFNVKPKIGETQLCEYLQAQYQPQKLMLVCAAGGYFRYMQSLKPFWQNYPNRVWVSLRTTTTEREIEDSLRYWGYPTFKNNFINFIRNFLSAFSVVLRQKPDVVITTSSFFSVPYLLLARWLCGSKVICIESKTRFHDVSLATSILMKLQVLDLIVVRSEIVANRYPKSIYIPVTENIEDKLLTHSKNRDYKQASIVSFEQVAFIFSPEQLVFSTVREFLNDFQTICHAEEFYTRIVIDMSHTTNIDTSGLGALNQCLELASERKTELVFWSVSEPISNLIERSTIKSAFVLEKSTNTFRFSNSIQMTKVRNITTFGLFLFRTQKLLKNIPVLKIFYLVLKFFFPFIDIDPSVPVHPSVRSFLKRILDIVGSLIGLGLTALIFVPIAIAIVCESKGGIFFVQVRCGLLSKPFRIWKFRSMVQNAEQLRHKVENQVQASSQTKSSNGNDLSGDKFFKNADDPRVTRIGKFLRKTSLDEFPQFWNVLVGDMSLVGTRPPTFQEINSYELEVEYDDERYTEWNRLDVKPGITGVWQVNGRSNVRSFAEVVNYDIQYRKRWSIWYDLQLIAQTILCLFDKRNRAV